jgi:hypothetical protein
MRVGQDQMHIEPLTGPQTAEIVTQTSKV